MDDEVEEGAVLELDLEWVQGKISTDDYFSTVRKLVAEQSEREFRKAVGARVAEAI